MKILFTTITTLLLAAWVLPAQRSSSQESLHTPPRILVTVRGEDPPAIPVYSFIYPLTFYPQPEIFFRSPGESTLSGDYNLFDSPDATLGYADTNRVEDHTWNVRQKKQFDILNILGYRMTRHPGSVVALRGYHTTESGENFDVALRRAEAVRRYLHEVWRIGEERLPVLEPQEFIPPSGDTLLLPEGRRVDFITEHLPLFGRLDFLHISYKTEIAPIDVTILPNVESNDVVLITVRLLDEEGTVLDSLILEGTAEMEAYRGSLWPEGIAEDQPPPFEDLTLQCSLLLRGGEVRTAERVRVPLRSGVEDYRVIPSEQILPYTMRIPGYGPGQTHLSPLQKYWVRESLAGLKEMGVDPADGLLVIARGDVTLPEARPTGDHEEILPGTEEYEALSDLANRRADGVTGYLRDSLGILLLNAEWPDTVRPPVYSFGPVGPLMWKRGYLPNDALRTEIESRVEYRPQMREVFLLIGTRKEMEPLVEGMRQFQLQDRSD